MYVHRCSKQGFKVLEHSCYYCQSIGMQSIQMHPYNSHSFPSSKQLLVPCICACVGVGMKL